MQTLYPHCAGLDVHKKTVVAAYITGHDANGDDVFERQTFVTMTRDLLALADWLQERRLTHVALESTGEYGKPVYNILEDPFTLLVGNAHHVKHVPGRKTDRNDAPWLCKLLTHGLLSASFIPPPGQRELRELTRARSAMVRERTNLVNRLHKTLEAANIKLTSVVTDVQGVSARRMLSALLKGQTDTAVIADLAKGRLRSKKADLERALEGRFQATQQFIVSELLTQIDGLDETVARFDAEIEKHCAPFEAAVAHMDTIPGVCLARAQQIVAEVGTDMTPFPTAGHLCAWAGVAVGNHKSGGKTLCSGKRLSSRVRQGNHALKTALLQAAHAAAHQKNTYLAAQYRQIAYRRGPKKAAVAVAHTILVIAYRLMQRGEDYNELGGDFFDKRRPESTIRRLTKRLEQFGFAVTLNTQPTEQAA